MKADAKFKIVSSLFWVLVQNQEAHEKFIRETILRAVTHGRSPSVEETTMLTDPLLSREEIINEINSATYAELRDVLSESGITLGSIRSRAKCEFAALKYCEESIKDMKRKLLTQIETEREGPRESRENQSFGAT